MAWYHPPRGTDPACWSALLVSGDPWPVHVNAATPGELRSAIAAREAEHRPHSPAETAAGDTKERNTSMDLLNDGKPFKSSKSGAAGHCVTVQHLPSGGVAVAHSQDPDGVKIRYTPEEWTAFLEGAKSGEFDLPTV
ncbi:DUF397 domain-containing protein [Actinoplanes lobatus]|uniref:DUF397 domain-containing protein n=1 Tax=Actinoplanes lobatus TaxID=113568 RepID=A0A7W7HBL3_9ACTN|nr:DUF397 domain-containing protein [Actinoplanes lobatus]MBB4747157.1 hypothetical protein [Actinoplanes lobatus]